MDFSQKNVNFTFKFFLFFLLGIIFGGFWIFLGFKQWFFIANSASQSENVLQKNNFSQTSDNVKNSWELWVFSSNKLKKIYSIIDQKFYGFTQKSQEEIENKMAAAMIAGLGDKHSEYFTAEENEEFQSELSGDFEGIGAVVGTHELGAKIERILPNSPAEKFGLLIWDIVISADNNSLAGLTTTEAVKFIRGKKWTSVTLKYLRDSEEKTVSVTRDSVNIPSVEAKMIENSPIGYIQINSFGERTPSEFHSAINEMKKSGARGLLLDFRFNGGGYLTSAQTMLSEFLPRNSKIVTIKENNPINNESLFTNLLSSPDTEIPVVVLVNEYSASASEIVAGAMQDYKRGIIIGTKTYGKGSVQEMFPLGDGSMIKITIAQWYTPNDKNIDSEGIDPDVIVNFTDEDRKNIFDRQKDVAQKVLQKMIDGTKYQEIIDSAKDFSNL